MPSIYKQGNGGGAIPEGKILIDEVFANGIKVTHNNEYVYAILDSQDKFLFGIRADGTPVLAKQPVILE